jgi:phage terminase large subunit-like protein
MHILLAGEKDRRHRQKVRYDWARHARAEQKEPIGTWKVWLILAGRGFGKTRTGAETIRAWVTSKRAKRIALVGSSLDDARKVMVEGESGLLSVCPPDMRPVFYPSLGSVVWPCGATATLYSASHYDKLRGPQFDGAWVDELAKFDHAEATFDQLMLGLRLGESPRVIVTTTPQPLPFLK